MGSTPAALVGRRARYESQAHALWLGWRASGATSRTVAEARDQVARDEDFAAWSRLTEWLDAVEREDSEVARFESAVEAVVGGDEVALGDLLVRDPALICARSTRTPHRDAPVHRATLLHYVAANGVERSRQGSPPTAVAIATRLLDAGAEVDAVASMYGADATPMGMLVSSDHPRQAGVELPLVDLLVDRGSSLDGTQERSELAAPLFIALAHGHADAARRLVQRGARVGTLALAAGLGREDQVEVLLPAANPEGRRRALALAAQHGQAGSLRMLLDAGTDPNGFNPPGNHAHSTPLHQAALGGHLAVVRMLVEQGSRLDVKDLVHGGTPLGWSLHGKRPEVAAYLKSRGAT